MQNLKTILERELFKIIESKKIGKYDISAGYLGNGLTIIDKNREKNRDYLKIAHVGRDGKITWYDKSLPSNVKNYIKKLAAMEKKNPQYGGSSQQEIKEEADVNTKIYVNVKTGIDSVKKATNLIKSSYGPITEYRELNKALNDLIKWYKRWR